MICLPGRGPDCEDIVGISGAGTISFFAATRDWIKKRYSKANTVSMVFRGSLSKKMTAISQEDL